MAITATVIDQGYGTSADPSVTDSNITPGADRTILVGVIPVAGTLVGITGCGITWTSVNSDTISGTNWYVYRGSAASPTNGKLSFDLSTGGETAYIIVEVAGSDTTTTNGVVQQAKGTGTTSATATLAAFASSSNGVVAFYATADAGQVATLAPGSGYTELADFDASSGLTGFRHIGCEWRADNDTSVDGTMTNCDDSGIIAMEIAAASTATFGYPQTITF